MRDDSVEITGQAEFQAGDEDGGADTRPAEMMIRDKPDGAADPLGEAGWYLEHERLSRAMSLEEAGEGTGIHPYHLEAIELGDMTCLPERPEALAMVGAYAEFLGFDPEPLVEHYASHLPVPPLAAEVRHPANPRPLSSARILSFRRFARLPRLGLRRIPGGAGGLVAGIAGAVLLFASVSYVLMPRSDKPPGALDLTSTEYPAPPPPPPSPSASAADPMPTASTGAEEADVKVVDAPMPPAETQPLNAGQSGDDELAGTGLDGISSLIEKSVPPPSKSTKNQGRIASATDTQLSGEGRQFGADNGESHLTLKAKAPVWVRIEDAQGNVVMTQMLMKGDTYRVPNREGLVVIARDGGLLTYMIDGKEKGILGTPGEILVGRSLDLKSFQG